MVIDSLHDMARRLCDGIINCSVSVVAAIMGYGIWMNGSGDMVLRMAAIVDWRVLVLAERIWGAALG